MMPKLKWVKLFLAIALVALSACAAQPAIVGLWQSIDDPASRIEFTAGGEVVVVDNMAGTVKGRYVFDTDKTLRIEFSEANILAEAMQPVPAYTVTATIIKFDNDTLQMDFADGSDHALESFVRADADIR